MYICIDSRRHDAQDVVDLTVDTGEIVDLTSCNNNNSVVRNFLLFYNKNLYSVGFRIVSLCSLSGNSLESCLFMLQLVLNSL